MVYTFKISFRFPESLITLFYIFHQASKTEGNSERTLEMCVFDNRGIGKSSVPKPKSAYSTDIMAADALGVMVRVQPSNLHLSILFEVHETVSKHNLAASPFVV
jgi:hypothetical protein